MSFLSILLLIYPTMVLLRGDDFGYVMSIVRTYAAGHPVTDAWLEPNNLFPESLGAVSFWLTRNFYLSTFGWLFVAGVAVYPLLYALLRRVARLDSAVAAMTTFLVVTFPFCLNKFAEYTGVPFYLCFFVLALLAFFEGRRHLFCAAAFMTFCRRESAVVRCAGAAF